MILLLIYHAVSYLTCLHYITQGIVTSNRVIPILTSSAVWFTHRNASCVLYQVKE